MGNRSKEKNGIEVALFDFGGVLSEEGFKNGLKAIARSNGLDEDGFVKTANDVIHACGYLVGKTSEAAYWKLLREVTSISGDDLTIRNELLSRFSLRKWMIDAVKRLKAAGIRVGILSDQTNWLDELDARDNFFRLFDYVFNSYHMGTSKRDVSHFKEVVRILETDPQNVLFIDDDPGNCERARQAGLMVIHYIDRRQFLAEIARHFPELR
ncbi:MAG TPA: HAD family phosphatase [Syntrophales bacterium]|nr:HAD family phosphatase [Syntrophales bacterium]